MRRLQDKNFRTLHKLNGLTELWCCTAIFSTPRSRLVESVGNSLSITSRGFHPYLRECEAAKCVIVR